MYKKILVATDSSKYSRQALSTAITFASVFGAEIELLHVVVEPESYGIYSTSLDLSDDRLDEIGDKIFERTLKGLDTKQVKITKKVLIGRPSTTINDEVKSQNIDLVVIGERGYAPFLGSFVGSVTLRVIAEASCPVVVVK